MTPTRRHVVTGLAAGLIVPHAATAAWPDLRRALDAAASEDPDAALRHLSGFDADALHGGDRLDLVTARAGLAIDATLTRDFPFGRRGRAPYRVTPLAGAWKTPQPDAAAIDADTSALRADAEAGVVLPRASLDATIAALAASTGPPAVAAALARQATALATLRDRAASSPGIGRFRGGADWYALLLQRSLGTMTPQVAERRLTIELDRLHARATRLFERIGAPKASVADRYRTLFRDPRFLYPDSDDGRARLIAEANTLLATARARLPAAFAPLPAWCLDVSARALTPAEIAAGRGGYRDIPAPGRPGGYVVDLKDIRRRPRWTLPSMVAHELLPGHMIQLGLEGQTPPHPLRLDYASAFVEGWGVHAEQLADSAGAYAEPHAALGHVHWLLFRVARALADLGIHLHGWSIDRARAALEDWMGEPAYFAPFDVELARIPLEPATRVAEAMAWLAIADAACDRRPVAFHTALLAHGRRRIDDIGKPA